MRTGLGSRGWVALVALASACGDDSGENLSDSGFTTGGDTSMTASATMTTMNPSTSSTTTMNPSTTTDETTTSETTETTMQVSVTETTTTGEETTITTSETTESDTTTTGEPTTTETTDPTTTTGPIGRCGDNAIDDGLVCFGDATAFTMGATPSDVVTGDFDEDGSFDVATTNTGDNNVTVRLGNGAGSLGEVHPATIGGTNPVRLEAADLDADGRWDIVTVNLDTDNASVLIASGGGDFAASVEVATGDAPTDLALALLDANTSPDLVVANSGSDDYMSAVNDGLGGFTVDPGSPWVTGMVGGAVGIAVGPINGNPVDSWFCSGGGYGATPGNGNGSFQDMTIIAAATGTALGNASGGEVNGDVDMDVVAVDATTDMAYFFLGGAMAAYSVTALDAGADPTEGVIADVTGEGDADVIVVSGGENTVTVFAGDGTGALEDGVTFDVGAAPTGVAVADFNEDGVGDIVVSNADDDGVSVLLSDP